MGRTTRPLQDRLYEHLKGSGSKRIRHLASEIGRDAFEIRVLELNPSNSHDAEVYWYRHFLASDDGQTLNGCVPGQWAPQTPESVAKISAALKGRPLSLKTRAKMKGRKSPLLGVPCRPETKEKLSMAQRGRPKSSETVAKMRAADRMKVQCGDCEKVITPGCLANHQKFTGHQGRVP